MEEKFDYINHRLISVFFLYGSEVDGDVSLIQLYPQFSDECSTWQPFANREVVLPLRINRLRFWRIYRIISYNMVLNKPDYIIWDKMRWDDKYQPHIHAPYLFLRNGLSDNFSLRTSDLYTTYFYLCSSRSRSKIAFSPYELCKDFYCSLIYFPLHCCCFHLISCLRGQSSGK